MRALPAIHLLALSSRGLPRQARERRVASVDIKRNGGGDPFELFHHRLRDLPVRV